MVTVKFLAHHRLLEAQPHALDVVYYVDGDAPRHWYDETVWTWVGTDWVTMADWDGALGRVARLRHRRGEDSFTIPDDWFTREYERFRAKAGVSAP